MDLFDANPGPYRWLHEGHACIWHAPGWFDRERSSRLLERLIREVTPKAFTVTVYGRTGPVPRLQAWHGDEDAGYQYSGATLRPEPWTPTLREIAARVCEFRPGTKFNSVLINLYRDGQDSVGWHADDERELGPNPTIASLSLGATRRFLVRPRGSRGRTSQAIELNHGDLLWMEGEAQKTHVHCAPRTARPVGPRWNLTFRMVRQGAGPTRGSA